MTETAHSLGIYMQWYIYVYQEGAFLRHSNIQLNFRGSTTNGMKPNASNTMSARSLIRLMTRQRYKKIALYRQILLEIFAALIFSIIRNESKPLSFYRNKQSKTDTLRVSTFDCRIFESL